MQEKNVIVMDVDGTICSIKKKGESYLDVLPNQQVVDQMKSYKEKGFYIVLFTSRNMRSYDGNLGKINANTAKDMFSWLEKYDIPYDEIYFGKPWCGFNGFYVDDKAIRPDEFVHLSYEEIAERLERTSLEH